MKDRYWENAGLFYFIGNCVLWNKKRSAGMRTRRKGRWLLKQPRLGARMCQGTFFFISIFMPENWLFCCHPLYYIEEKSKKETAMWRGITPFEKSLKGPEHDSGPFCMVGNCVLSYLTLSCGPWKDIEMGKEGKGKNSTACFDLFWKK